MRITTPARLTAALATTAVIAVLAACSPETTPGSPSASPTASESVPPQEPVDARIEFDDLTVQVTVPGRFGEGELVRHDIQECTRQNYNWGLTPSDASEPGELLAVSTTDHACPDEQAVNGRFPTWDKAAQLPDDAEHVDTPVGKGHRFSLSYTQCTNSCSEFDYDVVFVEAPGGKSFWIQASGIDDETLDGIVGSLTLP